MGKRDIGIMESWSDGKLMNLEVQKSVIASPALAGEAIEWPLTIRFPEIASSLRSSQ
jgi:hypothetical protein